jgi:hypothetical protein
MADKDSSKSRRPNLVLWSVRYRHLFQDSTAVRTWCATSDSATVAAWNSAYGEAGVDAAGCVRWRQIIRPAVTAATATTEGDLGDGSEWRRRRWTNSARRSHQSAVAVTAIHRRRKTELIVAYAATCVLPTAAGASRFPHVFLQQAAVRRRRMRHRRRLTDFDVQLCPLVMNDDTDATWLAPVPRL